MLYGGGDAGTLRFPLFILYANVRQREREREAANNNRAASPTTTFIYLPFFVTYLSTRRYTNGCCVDPARVILLYYPFGLRERRQTGDFPSIIYIQSERRRRREKGQRDKNRDVRC